MHKLSRLFACLGIILTMVSFSACSPNAVSPTPTQTVLPSDTPLPSVTPEPSEAPIPTNPPSPAETQELTTTQPALTPAGLTSIAPTLAGGATQPAAQPPAASVPDKAQYITQNFADGYRFRPGTPVTIVWTVKNIGTTGWSTSYTLRYFAGEKSTKDSFAFPKTVQPGGTLDLVVNLVVPTALGTYTTWWKLANGLGQNFSDVDFTFQSANTAGPPLASPTP